MTCLPDIGNRGKLTAYASTNTRIYTGTHARTSTHCSTGTPDGRVETGSNCP